MKLPSCSVCEYSFQWKELIFIMGSKKCPDCGGHQYVTARRKRHGLWFGPAAGILTAITVQVVNLPFSLLWPAAAGIIIAAFMLNPFWLEFTEKEEPLF